MAAPARLRARDRRPGAVADTRHGQRAGAKRRRRRCGRRRCSKTNSVAVQAVRRRRWRTGRRRADRARFGLRAAVAGGRHRLVPAGRVDTRIVERVAAAAVRQASSAATRMSSSPTLSRRARRRGPPRCGPAPGRPASRRRRRPRTARRSGSFGVGQGDLGDPGAAAAIRTARHGRPRRSGRRIGPGRPRRPAAGGSPRCAPARPGGVHVDGQSETGPAIAGAARPPRGSSCRSARSAPRAVGDPSRSMCTRPIAAASSMMSTRWSCSRLTSST